MITELEEHLNALRHQKPLVLSLTNYVTMDYTANALLALGASPIMSCSIEELPELLKIANALYINIGTLDDAFVKRAEYAASLAQKLEIPITLDPVGSGASKLRTRLANTILPFANIVKGNASEVMSLHSSKHAARGVDSDHETHEASDIAQQLASEHDCIVSVSGKIDLLTDGTKLEQIPLGHPLMTYVTGMGCSLGAVVAAFSAVSENHFDTTYNALSYFGLCGYLASVFSSEPGSFRTAFIDELYKADFDAMKATLDRTQA